MSVPNLLAALTGRSSCTDLQESDALRLKTLLQACAVQLETCRHVQDCRGLRTPCARHVQPLHVLVRMLLPPSALRPQPSAASVLLLLPLARHRPSLPLYRALLGRGLLGPDSAGALGLRFDSSGFGLASGLVAEVLVADTRWLALGGSLIFLLAWASTGSLCLTLATHLLVCLSLVLGYACYSWLFRIRDFPFVNMMTLVLAIAVGADDVFIYSHVWSRVKADQRDLALPQLLASSLRHAGMSIFVTSFSTSAALFANAFGRIAAVKCFAVYAGAVVVINLLLVILCVPACTLLADRKCVSCPRRAAWSRALSTAHRKVFLEALPSAVLGARYLWLLLGPGITAASLVVIFAAPGFHFTTAPPAFYRGTHPEELYARQRARFAFERDAAAAHRFRLRFVWGALPEDGRDAFTEASSAPFRPDPAFDAASREAQLWLRDLCNALHTVPRAAEPALCPFATEAAPFSFANFAAFYKCGFFQRCRRLRDFQNVTEFCFDK